MEAIYEISVHKRVERRQINLGWVHIYRLIVGVFVLQLIERDLHFSGYGGRWNLQLRCPKVSQFGYR